MRPEPETNTAGTEAARGMREARLQTLVGVAKKLPVFLFALAACWSLYCLDSYKRSYDRARKEPIFVNDTYMDELGDALREANPHAFREYSTSYPLRNSADEPIRDDEGRPLSLSVRKVIEDAVELGRFKNGEEMLEAIQESIASERDEKIKYLSLTADNLAKVLAAAPAPDEGQKAAPGGEADLNKIYETKGAALLKLRGSVEKTIRNYKDEAAERYRRVATTLRPDQFELKFVRRGETPAGLLYPAFEPVLDEQGGLYVIYQMLWLAAAGLLVFCLIAVVSLAFRFLLIPDGTGTFAEQAKALLTAAPAAAASSSSGGAARSAVISIAALGTATAVAVGGATINTKANRALAASASAEATAAPARPRANFTRTPSTRPTTAPQPPGPPLDLSPLVGSLEGIGAKFDAFGKRLEEGQRVGVEAVTNHLNTTNNILDARLPERGAAPPAVEVKIPGLDKNTETVTSFAAKVQELSEKFGGLATGMASCCANTQRQSQPPFLGWPFHPARVSPDEVSDLQERLKAIKEQLDRLEAAGAQSAPEPAPAKPYRPGIISRVLPPYGDDLYMLGTGSYRSLENMMQGLTAAGKREAQSEQAALLDALRGMVGQPPAGKSAFLAELLRRLEDSLTRRKKEAREAADKLPPSDPNYARLDAAATLLDKKSADAILKPWAETVLRHARIR